MSFCGIVVLDRLFSLICRLDLCNVDVLILAFALAADASNDRSNNNNSKDWNTDE